MPTTYVVRVTLQVASATSCGGETGSYSTLLIVDPDEWAAAAHVSLATRRAEMLGYLVVGVEQVRLVSSSFGEPRPARRRGRPIR